MILMNDFTREPEALKQAMVQACERVIRSGWYVLGPEVEAFEQEWAAACGTRFGVGVGNGMDAIEIALRCLDIGPGDEVITTSVTAYATALAIVRAGATPVIADIDPNTGLMSMESVQRCLSPRTRAVVLVHLYGQVCHMSQWLAFCNSHGIQLIEDCAQSHLAKEDGKTAGSFGVASAFSFYPTKNLGAVGDAGMLLTSDATVAQKAKMLRNYGQADRYHHDLSGLNSRLDEIHAAMLRARLPFLQQWTEKRQAIASLYNQDLQGTTLQPLRHPTTSDSHVYHLYVAKTAHRDQVRELLSKAGVQTQIHYPVATQLQKALTSLGTVRTDPTGLGHSQAFTGQCLSLPCHPWLTDEEVTAIVQACKDLADKLSA